jgi:hypothetical protein
VAQARRKKPMQPVEREPDPSGLSSGTRRDVPLRPERHTPHSLRTIRQLLLYAALRWLPRCPTCRRAFDDVPTRSRRRRKSRNRDRLHGGWRWDQ